MSALRPEGPARTDRAFVTLVTNADFAEGAAALLHSLALTGSDADRVVLHTEAVPADALAVLEHACAVLEMDMAELLAHTGRHHLQVMGEHGFTRGLADGVGRLVPHARMSGGGKLGKNRYTSTPSQSVPPLAHTRHRGCGEVPYRQRESSLTRPILSGHLLCRTAATFPSLLTPPP